MTAAAGFTNAGTITLESIAPSSNPNHATLAVTSGVLTNAATGVLNFSPGSNVGIRILDAELFNQGTVNVERNTTFARSVTNEGVFDIAAGTTASMSGSEQTFSQAAGDLLIEGDLSFSSTATYDQSGGNLVANGTLTVTSATFNHDGGSFSGSGTAIVTDGHITFQVPTPTIPIIARRSNTLAGDIPEGQSLVVQGITAASATLTAAAGFTNAGTITLESIAVASNPSHATLAVTSGVLINAATGVLNFSPGSNQGIRILDAELFNQGTVNVDHTPSFTKPITNEGLFDIASGVTLTLSGAIQTFTQFAGTLNVTGQ